MSLEVIEMMIKESLRDGEISASERETLVKQGESFGISKETVVSMIDAEVDKLNSKVNEEKKKQQEADEIRGQEKVKREKEKKNEEKEIRWYNWNEDGFFGDQSPAWISVSMIVFAILGIVNAYTHSKAWYAYIGMFFLFAFYGFVFYTVTYLISMITKRVPFLDWYKPVLIAYSSIVLAIICYLVIPF